MPQLVSKVHAVPFTVMLTPMLLLLSVVAALVMAVEVVE
jgi:hypothetical protein